MQKIRVLLCLSCPLILFRKVRRTMKTLLERFNELDELARMNGGKSLNKEYISSRTKYVWQCKEGHMWQAMTSSIRNGSWCPICARKRNGKERLNIEIMQEIAQKHGGRCVSETYKGSHIPLKWSCEHNHLWEMKPARARQGGWCPICTKLKRVSDVTYEEIAVHAKRRGGRLLTAENELHLSELQFECQEGHQWTARWGNVRSGTWCKKCSYEQKKLTLSNMHALAKKRNGLCLSTTYVRSTIPLTWQCHMGHQWSATPSSISQGSWCPTCSYTFSRRQKQTIAYMESLAKLRGGRCVSKEYHDVHTALLWECRCGFQWKATPASIKRGQWCPVCK